MSTTCVPPTRVFIITMAEVFVAHYTNDGCVYIRASGSLNRLLIGFQSPSAERASRANLKPDRGDALESTFLASAST